MDRRDLRRSLYRPRANRGHTRRDTECRDSRLQGFVRYFENDPGSGVASARGVPSPAHQFVRDLVSGRLHRERDGYGQDAVFVAEFSRTGPVGAAAAAIAEAVVLRVGSTDGDGRKLFGVEAKGVAPVSQDLVAAAGGFDWHEPGRFCVHREQYAFDPEWGSSRHAALKKSAC